MSDERPKLSTKSRIPGKPSVSAKMYKQRFVSMLDTDHVTQKL